MFVKVTDKPVSAANNEKYLNQFFLTQISINSDSDHDDGFFPAAVRVAAFRAVAAPSMAAARAEAGSTQKKEPSNAMSFS